MSARICVVGSLNTDLVARAARLPEPGETVMGASFATFPGGKGANQAVAAARLGAEVAMIGCLGSDEHGRAYRALLEAEGIGHASVRTVEGAASGVALITVDEEGENSIVVIPGANHALSAEDVRAAAEAIEEADHLLLQLEVPLPAVREAVAIAAEAPTTVTLNAAPARSLPPEVLRRVSCLIVNRREAEQLLPGGAPEEPETLARALLARGPLSVIVTLGEDGAVFASEGRVFRQEGFLVRAVDATAAGDAFAAACAVMHAEGVAPESALPWACAAGALATTRAGAQPSLPTRAQVDRLAATLQP